MTFPRGRARRPDDWPSSHVRARAALSDRLDEPLEPAEAEWLETHLGACSMCTRTAADYAAQQIELRGLRDRTPVPPRDLWARTAAAIESESRFRDANARPSGRRRSALAPYAVLSAAVAVAVIVGTLTSSRPTDVGGTAAPSHDIAVASNRDASAPSSKPGSTPLAVAERVEWLSVDPDGAYRVQVANVDEVCAPDAVDPCDSAAPVEDQEVALDRNLSSVFGSEDGDALIVFNNPDAGDPGSVNVVRLADRPASPSPSIAPSPTLTASAAASEKAPASPSIAPPRATPTPKPPTATPTPKSPSPTPSTAPVVTPTPTAPASPPPSVAPSLSPSVSPPVAVSPSPSTGTVEIARDVVLVGQTAAYSPDGSWFAFTARPADGSLGPDIYVWRVGAALALPATLDHRSVFGSWDGSTIVGSTVTEARTGSGNNTSVELTPESFLLDPATQEISARPEAGRAWRPVVDPSGRKAVYWAGTLRATESPGFAPDAGRLVLGSWSRNDVTDNGASAAPLPSALTDQAAAHGEVTIAAGRMDDWDARWDTSGTHLAVWIADSQDPSVGRLSLYAVNGFDGRIDLKKPLLDAQRSTAGFAISEGQLVWATPSADGSVTGTRIQVLAWTDKGQGQVESVPGPVVVIR